MNLDNIRKAMTASHQSSAIARSMGSIEQVLVGTLQRVNLLFWEERVRSPRTFKTDIRIGY